MTKYWDLSDETMGHGGYGYQITVMLDEHGGEKEKQDQKLWEELTKRLAEIAREKKYEHIVVSMSFDSP